MANKITAANYVPSLIRTYTPSLVGLVLAFLTVHFGFSLSVAATTELTAVLTAAFTAAYFSLVRALELKYPKMRFLLGHPSQPQVYANPKNIKEQPGGVRTLKP